MAKAKLTRSKLSGPARRRLIEQHLKERDAGKRHYEEAEKLLEELLAGGVEAGETVELAGDQVATMVDNFATKNKHFKTAGVNRFEIKVSYRD